MIMARKALDPRILGDHTPSLENHQDGVYLHRHGVTLSLQAILMCSILPAITHNLAIMQSNSTGIYCP